MSTEPRVLLIFQSIHHVLAAEAALKGAGVPAELVPVPKEISPNCGMAIALAPADRARALRLIEGRGLVETRDGWEA